MSPSTLVAALATAVALATGTPMLISSTEPTATPATIQAYSEVYPKGVTWQQILAFDPQMKELGTCESTLNPLAVNYGDAKITGHPSHGLLQFQPMTFRSGVKKYNAMPGATNEEIDAAIKDPYIQLFVARRMIDDGQGRQWSCFTKRNLAVKYPSWKPTKTVLALKELD